MGIVENFVQDTQRSRAGSEPILKSVSYKVKIKKGLARVRVARLFANTDDREIEAIMTFPVPFDAVVTRLKVVNDGRVLRGDAVAKVQARETYEEAIDSGKAAVLHEELLRGLHMVSVGNVLPGKEISVETEFALPVSMFEGNAFLSIPQTVGQIYGQSPFSASDDIVANAAPILADLQIEGDFKEFEIYEAANGKIANDLPISIRIPKYKPGKLVAVTAENKLIELEISAFEPRIGPIDCDILLDKSGSMSMSPSASIGGESKDKHTQVIDVLRDQRTLAVEIDDRITGWEFDNHCRKVFEGSGRDLKKNVDLFSKPSRGTNIASAVEKVIANGEVSNVLLITDGRSHIPIDIQKAVKSGACFTVVLVGNGALEANVGHLAAMTGGRMFIAAEDQVTDAIFAAFNSMCVSDRTIEKGKADAVRPCGGSTIFVRKIDGKTDLPERKGFARIAAAYAAHVLGQAMNEEQAAKYFAAEGIVSHLTSIVLVDEAAEATEELPKTKKVSLAANREFAAIVPMGYSAPKGVPVGSPSSVSLAASAMRSFSASSFDATASLSERVRGETYRGSDIQDWEDVSELPEPPVTFPQPSVTFPDALIDTSHLPDLTAPEEPISPRLDRDFGINQKIDWMAHSGELAKGDPAALPKDLRSFFDRFAEIHGLHDIAAGKGDSAILLAIMVLASEAAENGDRYAARVRRSLVAAVSEEGLSSAISAYASKR